MSSKKIDTEFLYEEFGKHVRSFIRSRVSGKQEAEDIVQDIFTRIHKGINTLNNEERVESWVFGIARRALADHYRSKGRNREEPAMPESVSDETAVVDQSDDLNDFDGDHDVHEEVMSWLVPMIDELPPKYARPLKMADVEGMPQKEIAEKCDLSLSGAKSRIQRAREKLGDVLAACCEVQFGKEGRAVAYHKRSPDSD